MSKTYLVTVSDSDAKEIDLSIKAGNQMFIGDSYYDWVAIEDVKAAGELQPGQPYDPDTPAPLADLTDAEADAFYRAVTRDTDNIGAGARIRSLREGADEDATLCSPEIYYQDPD
jgi:hypothetical protein